MLVTTPADPGLSDTGLGDTGLRDTGPAGLAPGDLGRLLDSFRLLMLNHSRVLDHQGDLFGLGDTDIRFLFYVWATGDRVTPKRAADHLDLSSGAMTNLVDRLVEAGHLDRRRNPDDRRSVIVNRTPRGVEVTTAIASAYAAAFADVVPASQHGALADTLLDLGRAFDRHGVGASPAAPAASAAAA